MRNAIRYEVTPRLGVGGLRLERENQVGPEAIPALAVDVVYTTEAGTQGALEKAWALAQDLGAHVRLVSIYTVPYTLSLGNSAVSLSFLRDKLSRLASGFSGEASVQIYLCRETRRALPDVLSRFSLSFREEEGAGGPRTRKGWKDVSRNWGAR
jgi:hypothetical protein